MSPPRRSRRSSRGADGHRTRNLRATGSGASIPQPVGASPESRVALARIGCDQRADRPSDIAAIPSGTGRNARPTWLALQLLHVDVKKLSAGSSSKATASPEIAETGAAAPAGKYLFIARHDARLPRQRNGRIDP